nr:MAG TPA: hypothetical protein [Caudoviricetes sp.]
MKLSSNTSSNSFLHFSIKIEIASKRRLASSPLCRIYFPISVVALLLYRTM